MYELEPDKTMVCVNVRRYLLNCHEQNRMARKDEVQGFCNKTRGHKYNPAATRVFKKHTDDGSLLKVKPGFYRVLNTELIKSALLKFEDHRKIRSPIAEQKIPQMPIQLFKNGEVVKGVHRYRICALRHIIYCHKHNYAIRRVDLKTYSTYRQTGAGSPNIMQILIKALKKIKALSAIGHGNGFYQVTNIRLISAMLKRYEGEIIRESFPKVGRPRKTAEEHKPKESLKRDQERTRYWNNRQTLSKERQHDATPAWLVMTEAVVMNMNGTARHAPEIVGRRREFCR